MAFIDKLDPQVLDIKLTSKGRELLSQGKLNIKYFGLGDSEIDYKFLSNTGLSTSGNTLSILKPVDNNPNLLSFINKNGVSDNLYEISAIDSTFINPYNTQEEIGFFNINGGTIEYKTNLEHSQIKYHDKYSFFKDFKNNSIITIQGFTTETNAINSGDIIIVKFAEDVSITTTPSINVSDSTIISHIIYNVVTGSEITGTSITVTVDRNVPDFTYSGSLTEVGMIILEKPPTGETYNYTSQDIIDATFENNILSTETNFPYWNLSIIYTEEIAGVSATNKKYSQFKTAEYGGFVSYVQGQSSVIKKLGVIHYSNMSPLNTYGESLFENSPIVTIPTVMWHKSTTQKLGVILTGSTVEKKIVSTNPNTSGLTNTFELTYHDLVDESGYVIGKIFNDLKLFVIEDQELLFALSYKSNRSWSLPNYNVGFDENYSRCATCDIVVQSINVNNIMGSVDIVVDGTNQIIAEAFSGSTSIKASVLSSTGNTFTMILPEGNYSRVLIRDIATPSCTGETTSFIILPIYDLVVNFDPSAVSITGTTVYSGITGTTVFTSGQTLSVVSGTTVKITTTELSTGYTISNWILSNPTVTGSTISGLTGTTIIMNSDRVLNVNYTQMFTVQYFNEYYSTPILQLTEYLPLGSVVIVPFSDEIEYEAHSYSVSGATTLSGTTATNANFILSGNTNITTKYWGVYSKYVVNILDDEGDPNMGYTYYDYLNTPIATVTIWTGAQEIFCTRFVEITSSNAYTYPAPKSVPSNICSPPSGEVNVQLDVVPIISGETSTYFPLKWHVKVLEPTLLDTNFSILVTDPNNSNTTITIPVTVLDGQLYAETSVYNYIKIIGSSYTATGIMLPVPPLYTITTGDSYVIPASVLSPSATADLFEVIINHAGNGLYVNVAYSNTTTASVNMRIRVQNVTKGSPWVQGVVHAIPSYSIYLQKTDQLNYSITHDDGDEIYVEFTIDGGSNWTSINADPTPIILPFLTL